MNETDKKRISIIVPVYNVCADLPRCLDSLLAQTYRNIEIIAVDDGSTDGSGEVLDVCAQKDTRIKVIHKENGGVSSARLRGIEAATGDYIGFCDGDDYVEPQMYGRLLENLLAYDADISHCGHRVVRPDKPVQWFYNTGRLAQQSASEALRGLLAGSFEPALGTKLYKRGLLKTMVDRDCLETGIRINEDLLMNYFLFSMSFGTVFEDVCPYHYLKREGSASTAKVNYYHVHDPLAVKQIIWKDCLGTNMAPVAEEALLRTALNTWNALTMAAKNDFLREREEARYVLKGHSGAFSRLSKKQRLFANMILHTPWLYKPVYKLYRKMKKR